MQIAILCIYSIILSTIACLYFSFVNVDDETVDMEKIKTCMWADKKALAYVVLMALCLCGMSIELPIVYNNTIIENLKLISLLGILFVVALTDFRKYIIPNAVILVGIVLRCIFYIVELVSDSQAFWGLLKNDIIACLIIVVFFIVGVFVVKNGLGMGDIKLMLVMCLFQGFYGVISSIFFSLIVAFVFSVVLLVTRKKTRKDAIAFAPSILVGTLISVFLTGM